MLKSDGKALTVDEGALKFNEKALNSLRTIKYIKGQSGGILTISSLTLHCHHHPLQAANCYRNSRLVVDEDGLTWFKN